MAVWDHLSDFDYVGRLLSHAAQPALTKVVTDLLTAVRLAKERDDMRDVQTELFGYLSDAESRYAKAQRAYKRREGPLLEADFWRRACVQLRTVGDAIAWKFLGYNRKQILLLMRGDHSGHFHGKAGTDVEWALFSEHWDAGEPTLLTGLTMCLRTGDLLVDMGGGTIKIVEAKKQLRHKGGKQKRRALDVVRQFNVEARHEGDSGPSWIVETNVPLRTYWKDSGPALDRAYAQGAATWVPAPGLGILFMVPSVMAGYSEEAGLAMLESERLLAGQSFGEAEHRILLPSLHYPYRAGAVAPLSIFPIDTGRAAQLVTGDLLFQIELDPERLAIALRAQGVDARMVLPPNADDLVPSIDVLHLTHGSWSGVMHPAGVEALAVELQDREAWAKAISTANLPERDPRFGLYVTMDETDTWELPSDGQRSDDPPATEP